MHHLGLTRSVLCADHILQTLDAFVRAPLPGMRNATAIVHIAPAGGARFTQYTAEMEPGGVLPPSAAQRFAYVLEGNITTGSAALSSGDYLYSPPGMHVELRASKAARVGVIEKAYEPLPGVAPPEFFTG